MRTLIFGLTAWLLSAAGAAAQDPGSVPLERGDLHFVIGWQNLHREQPQQHYNDWMNGIFYGGTGVGWYWSDHLKTQVDFGAGTRGRQFRYEPIVVNGQQTVTSSRLSVNQQSVAVAQHYQFFENQWFHPHVGVGVDIARETTREDYDPVLVFDPVTRGSRLVSPRLSEGPEHRIVARPFGEVGLKAYTTRRTFFTADTRLMFRRGIDEVLFRLGFGVDF